MQFAINYSPQAASLLQLGAIHVDRFKCPNWDWLIAEAIQIAPVYVHFDLKVGDGSIVHRDWGEIVSQIAMTGTPYLNLHPDVHLSDYGWQNNRLTAGQIDQVIEQVVRDIAVAVHRVGAERVILENVPYRGRFVRKPQARTVRVTSEPDVFRRVIQATGINFLLDLSHAALAAEALGTTTEAYVQSLPLGRLRELHVTGVGVVNGQKRDHLAMSDEDWAHYEWFIGEIHQGKAAAPWIVAFEYGGVGEKFAWRSDPGVIMNDAPRLYRTMKQLAE